ncbi:MAG: hypothetical protein IPJ40_13030 [Saprospirales bacterium]|nr:hypothetical protein [Saprospirales bacterium]
MYHLLLLVLLISLGAPPKKPPKIALLITISHYAEGSGWDDLHANKDAELMEYALLQQGFQKENIIHLQDAQATRQRSSIP